METDLRAPPIIVLRMANIYQRQKPSNLPGSDATKIQYIKDAKSSDGDIAPRHLFIRSGERV